MAAVYSSADGFSARERKYVTEIIHRRTSPMCAIFLSPYHRRRPKWILSILKQNSLRIQDWQNKGHYVDINLGGKSAGLPFLLLYRPSRSVYVPTRRRWSKTNSSSLCVLDECTPHGNHFFLSPSKSNRSHWYLFRGIFQLLVWIPFQVQPWRRIRRELLKLPWWSVLCMLLVVGLWSIQVYNKEFYKFIDSPI